LGERDRVRAKQHAAAEVPYGSACC
jgi:hypothetical protein